MGAVRACFRVIWRATLRRGRVRGTIGRDRSASLHAACDRSASLDKTISFRPKAALGLRNLLPPGPR